jgi:hypothetical protein
MKKNAFLLAGLLITGLAGCRKEEVAVTVPETIIFSASGDIQSQIDAFRSQLGPVNTGAAAAGGRREINWDAVPEDQLGKPLPDNFFNPIGPTAIPGRQRGLMYTPKGGSFAVSKLGFTDINPGLKTGFKPFSGSNTFANTSASLWEVAFQVPGQSIAASVQGFGAVFSDVDQPNTGYLEFFDGSRSLGKHFIPAKEQSSPFSFLGVYFPGTQRVTRVVVSHHGTLVSGQPDISDGGGSDLFVLDDFFYSEPQARQ